jgi:hypothetical protein
MMAFYGIPMKHPRENGFICLKLGKISNVFIPYFSYSNFVCFRRSEEVEQLLLESVLENHNLLAQYRSNYKSPI